MIFLEDDVFRYAKFFTVIHIYSFQSDKCAFFRFKILLNFLFNLQKKLGFLIFLFENCTVSSSTIVLCIPSIRAFPIVFLTLKKAKNGLQSEFLKNLGRTGFYKYEIKIA